MKLFCTPNSPFSRVARVAVKELELDGRVDIEFVTVRDSSSLLLEYGPLGKVPALLDDNGQLFSDTRILLNLLEKAAKGLTLSASQENLKQLAFEGFAFGFLESICVWVREARRPSGLISNDLLEVEETRAYRCLDYLEDNIVLLEVGFGASAIAVACGIDIAMSRVGLNFKERHKKLRPWFAQVAAKESMLSTAFKSV